MQPADTHNKAEDVKDAIGDLSDHVTEFVETFYRLQVLNVTKKATDVTANVLGSLVVAVLGIFVILFGGIALAWWLGDILQSRAGGFLLVAGFFMILALVLVLTMKRLIFPKFRNMIIRKMYE